MDRIFELYKQALEIHIQTKTTCSRFHEKSADFYELLFDCFHLISEKRQDLEIDDIMKEEEAWKKMYAILEETKIIIEKMIKEKNSVWMDNLLRWLADKLENEIWHSIAFSWLI